MAWARASLTLKGREGVEALFATCKRAFAPKTVKTAIFPAARLIRDKARANAPLGKGHTKGGELRHLKTSIFAAYGKPDAYDVIAGVDLKKVPHAHLVEFGTNAHMIRPENRSGKKWLTIPPNAKSAIFRRLPFVSHPGAEKHPFFVPAIKSSRSAVVKLIGDGLTKLLEVKLGLFKTGKPSAA